MTVVVGLLVASAVLVGTGPRVRPRALRGRPLRRAGTGRFGDVVGTGPSGRGARQGPARVAGLLRGQARPLDGSDLATVTTTVCTLLRAGARPADAWAQALRTPGCGAVPTVDQVLRGSVPDVDGRRRRPTPGEQGRAHAVVAAALVAEQLGAPLAAVLDGVAAAVVADAEAEAELLAALSGPRASVRVLLGLPVLGVLLGAAVGADPVGVLLGGGLGTISGLLGCALVVAGWCWTRALIARARRAAVS